VTYNKRIKLRPEKGALGHQNLAATEIQPLSFLSKMQHSQNGCSFLLLHHTESTGLTLSQQTAANKRAARWAALCISD
jgi:hypothetical protein